MTQITSAKLDELNVIELYKHYAALEHSLPLLTDESRPMLQAELEACLIKRSQKIDSIHYCISSNERDLEQIKKEKELLVAAQRHAEAQVKNCKSLLNYLRCFLPKDTNKIIGRNYQFTLVRKPNLTIEISSDPQLWSTKDQNKYCLTEEITTAKRTVLRSLDGNIIQDNETPIKTTTKLIPNINAITDAYKSGQQLPDGVKVKQEYSIRTKRIIANSLASKASELAEQFFPED
jgi:hypothetical protein